MSVFSEWLEEIRYMAGEVLDQLLLPRGTKCVCCGDIRGLTQEPLCEYCLERYITHYDSVQWNHPHGVERMYSACKYISPASDLVKAYKFQHNGYAGEYMADEMCRAAEEMGLPPMDAVVAVPLHKKRLRQRGFNQSDLLAEALAETIHTPQLPLLVRTRNTRKQSRLGKSRRADNVADAFEVTRSCRGMDILLVDDVCTTGATGHACAKALLEAGARRVELFVYADATGK